MKKIIFLFVSYFLSNIIIAHSQSNYSTIQDSLYQHLDKSRIPSGVLYDRIYPWADLTNANITDTLNSQSLQQIWYELYLATYDNNEKTSLQMAKDFSTQNEIDGKGMSIGFINYQFNTIDTDAVDNNALKFGSDSLLIDGDLSLNPYINHSITLPMLFSDGVQGDSVKFFFDPRLSLSNVSGKSIQNINIKSAIGTEITLNPGSSAYLPIIGLLDSQINLIFTITFTDGTVSCCTTVTMNNNNLTTINSQTSNFCNSGYDPITIWSGNNLKFQGYDESIATEGKGQYKIFYHQQGGTWSNCDKHIRKPIIIIDGFDPQNKQRPKPDDIWELLSYDNNKHLGDDLRIKGYDIIVLNFPEYNTFETGAIRDGGADYMERNAMVLTKLIQQVNDSLIANNSNEQLVIIGPSMGGQIARYALAYMEKQNSLGVPKMKHNTRLYVSFDSPHKGANIPIAAQQALYHLGYYVNKSAAKESYDNQIRSKAARQLLIEQMDGLNKTASFFTQYYSNLNSNGLNGSNGWPINLRKVSIVNGNAAGVNTNIAGSRSMYVKANALAGLMRGLELNLFNMPNYSNSLTTYDGKVKSAGWGYLGSSSTSSIIPFFNNPNMWGTNTLSYLGIIYGIKTDRGVIGLSNQNSNGSMDIVPGGTFNTIEVFRNEIKTMLEENSVIKQSSIEWKDVNLRHSFIPSVSALAFKNTNFNWSTSFNNRNLVCTQEIPFDNYFTAQTNEEHVHISKEAAKWVTEEIDKGQVNCPQICYSSFPVGNNTLTPLCINATRNLYHNFQLPAGVTVSWSVADNPYYISIVSSSATSVTVKGLSETESAIVRYKIINPCGTNVEGSYSLKIGAPTGALILYQINSNTNGAKVMNYDPTYYDYYWGWNSTNWNYLDNEYYPSNFPTSNSNNPNQSQLCLKTSNNCGSLIECVNPYLPAAPINKNVSISLDSLSVYPNPTNDSWNITFTNTSLKSMKLYNSTGLLVWSDDIQGLTTSISSRNLSSGLYILNIQSGYEIKTIKLIKY